MTDMGEFATIYWPGVARNDWCGEHPDFPAYLTSLMPERPGAAVEPEPQSAS